MNNSYNTRPRIPATSGISRYLSQLGMQGIGLAVLRLVTGYLWYTQLGWKVPWTTSGYNELQKYVLKEAHYAIIPVYRVFIEQAILPNYTLIAYLTYFTEAFIALSLIFGILTRLGSLVGTLWAVQLYLGLSAAPGEWYWTYGMLVMVNVTLFFTDAGRFGGVDQWLRPRLRALANAASGTKARALRLLTRAA
jgi:uncharacterized membrane protein YphA (DoxX/SURF4 family)